MSGREDRLRGKLQTKPRSAHDILIQSVDAVNSNNNVDRNVNVAPRVSRRPKFEESHTRATFYIQNELLEQLNQFDGNEKGEKTRMINEALEAYLRNM